MVYVKKQNLSTSPEITKPATKTLPRFRIISVITLVRKTRNVLQIYKTKRPQHIFKLVPEKTHAHGTRNFDNIPVLKLDTTFSKTLSFLLQ